MSLLKANAVQLGQSITATNNFVWYQPASPDGTVRLGNGNSGSVTDLITVGTTGNLTFANSVSLSAASTKTLTLNGGAGSNGLVLDASNNVGIGVSPTSLLTTVSSGQVQIGTTSWPTSFVGKSNARTLIGNEGVVVIWNEAAAALGNAATIYLGPKGSGTNGSTIIAGGAIAGVSESNSTNNGALTFATNGGSGNGERMRLDSSGNLGLGAASTGYKLYVTGNTPSGGIFVQSNSGSDASPVIRVQGQRFDGNTTQAFSGGLALEKYYSGATITSGQVLGSIYFGGNYSGSSMGYAASISAVASANWSSTTTANTDLVFLTGSTAQTALGTANVSYGTERVRIDSSGNLLVGTTSAVGQIASVRSSDGSAGFFEAQNASQLANVFDIRASRNTTGGTYRLLSYYNTGAGAYKFYVIDGGNLYSTSATVNVISDQRLKENVRDLDTGLAEILALRPRRFDWKENQGDGSKNTPGFIAQEVEQVMPELVVPWNVTGTDKDDHKGLATGNLIPTLVKAIQELSAELNELKQRIK